MRLGRAIGKHALGQPLAGERLGQERERLRISRDFAIDIRGRVLPVCDREERRPARAVEQEHVTRLGDLGDRVDRPAVAAHGDEVRGCGQVPIPDVVPDELKMPDARAGFRLECDEGVGEQVVPAAVGPIVVVRRRARGHEHEAPVHVERHPGPVIGGAGIRPRVFRPGFVPELSWPGNRVEGPAQRPGSHVVRPHVARRRREALRRPAADDEQVPVDDPWRPERDHQLLAGPEAVPHVDSPALAERRNGVSRRGVQGIEKLLHRDEDPLVRAIAPVDDSACATTFAPHLSPPVRVEAPQQLAGSGLEGHGSEAHRRGVQDSAHHDGIDLQLGTRDPVAGVERPRHFEMRDVLARDLLQGRVSHALGAATVDRPVRRRGGLRRQRRTGEEDQGVGESHGG